MFVELLDIEDYDVFQPWVRLAEEKQAQSMMQQGQQENGAVPGNIQPSGGATQPQQEQGPPAQPQPTGVPFKGAKR